MAKTVTLADLEAWMKRDYDEVFASASGGPSFKSLEVSRSGKRFTVIDHGQIIYIGRDKSRAIAAYNAAP